MTVTHDITLFPLLLSSKVRNKRKEIIENKKDWDKRRNKFTVFDSNMDGNNWIRLDQDF